MIVVVDVISKRDDNAYDEECVGKREQKNDKHQALSASFEQIASNRKEGEFSSTWGVY